MIDLRLQRADIMQRTVPHEDRRAQAEIGTTAAGQIVGGVQHR
jgi:hypothetical protein